jgi:tRNA G37 N-methylase TrmD
MSSDFVKSHIADAQRRQSEKEKEFMDYVKTIPQTRQTYFNRCHVCGVMLTDDNQEIEDLNNNRKICRVCKRRQEKRKAYHDQMVKEGRAI